METVDEAALILSTHTGWLPHCLRTQAAHSNETPAWGGGMGEHAPFLSVTEYCQGSGVRVAGILLYCYQLCGAGSKTLAGGLPSLFTFARTGKAGC